MVGRTLTEIRSELESLATPEGAYYVRCGRTGERPVPVDGLRFPDRETAAEAARAAHSYRAALRRYDPQAPCYDFVVCERDDDRAWSFPPADGATRPLVAYCHDLAGAVFEALSEGDHGGVERAAMEAYLSAAETTPRDRLCLSLLSTTATTLRDRLSVAEQTAVVSRAATQLPAVSTRSDPVTDAFDHLAAVSLLKEFTARADGREVRVSGYRLPVIKRRLPTLPISVELHRRARQAPVVARARPTGTDDWTVSLSNDVDASDPVSVPVAPF